MNITICGSIAFHAEMDEAKKELEALGHEVKLPPYEVKDENGVMIPVKEYYAKRKASNIDAGWIWERKAEAIKWHFDKVAWSDAILVLNYDKNDITNYIGPNTFLEVGLAFYLGKKIFFLRDIPEMSSKEEYLAMGPIVIHGDLKKIV
jgi:hypothetical protein